MCHASVIRRNRVSFMPAKWSRRCFPTPAVALLDEQVPVVILVSICVCAGVRRRSSRRRARISTQGDTLLLPTGENWFENWAVSR